MSNVNQAEVVNENPANEPAGEPQGSIAEALCSAGVAWAEMGLGHARVALEGSAVALQRTAKLLDALRDRLRRPYDLADAG